MPSSTPGNFWRTSPHTATGSQPSRSPSTCQGSRAFISSSASSPWPLSMTSAKESKFCCTPLSSSSSTIESRPMMSSFFESTVDSLESLLKRRFAWATRASWMPLIFNCNSVAHAGSFARGRSRQISSGCTTLLLSTRACSAQAQSVPSRLTGHSAMRLYCCRCRSIRCQSRRRPTPSRSESCRTVCSGLPSPTCPSRWEEYIGRCPSCTTARWVSF
mmetsp:Transcript_99895/g.258130  ORF Transcript_99895/g.258130 Transcript_99895/m.258130 type:complete len:217 (-) Transcript_99895:689-1339(-)